uniref:ABC transporter domain-containing protein n=2 Tax=Tetranychus urticae TaxID=32264 RepID=T1KQ16_TETUR
MELVFRNIILYEPFNVKSNGLFCSKSSCLASKGEDVSITIDDDKRNQVNSYDSCSTATSSLTENRRILDDINGYARPGQVLGIMGPSGSGKSSLLNVLSGRLKPDQGCITLAGEMLNKRMKRKINYVLQHDIFLPNLTLRQTLKYNAILRLPESMSYSQKMKQVDNIIDILDLGQCMDTIIGDASRRGLSGGEKKRANIACELLSNPSVMLLDEPTSGLDSSTALGIMKFLKEYAMKERKIVIISIHQPSSQIFYLLDKLLLLSNGNLAYFGDSHSVVPFFSSIGFEITPNYNPADFMMETIKGSKQDQEKIISAARRLSKLPLTQRSRPPSLSSSSSPSSHQMKTSSIDHHSQDSDDNSQSELNPHPHHQHIQHHHSHQRRHHHRQDSLSEHHHQTEPDNHHDSNCDEDDIDNRVPVTPPNGEFVGDHDRADTNPLWPDGHESSDGHDTKPPGSTELRVIIDPCKKLTKIYTKIGYDDDSGRSSWTETDRLSTATFSSYSLAASNDEMNYAGSRLSPSSRYSSTGRIVGNEAYGKWPTSFWTQCKVLMQRNFHQSRGRMLSKLNWIQAIVLGVITGLMWFQIPRQESSLNDIRGWMFFATSYWQLFALFGTLVSLPPEKEVVNKERASGCYRLSAYYIAKLLGDLPSIVALPTAFYFISYPMFSFYSITLFIVQWFFFILNSVVAQTMGFVIGVTTGNLEVSMTISALYSMSTNLFGGFYSNMVPSWLTWAKYLSIVHYAFQNMQIIELMYGPPIKCSPSFSRFPSCIKRNETLLEGNGLFIAKDELLMTVETIGSTTGLESIGLNTFILLCFLTFTQIFGYIILRYVRKK